MKFFTKSYRFVVGGLLLLIVGLWFVANPNFTLAQNNGPISAVPVSTVPPTPNQPNTENGSAKTTTKPSGSIGKNFTLTEYADEVVQDGNLSSFTDNNWDRSLAGIACKMGGCKTSDGISIDTGMLPTLSRSLAFLITEPPVKSSTYIADVGKSLGIAQPAYAQGVGFAALTPVLGVWKAFRNIAYFFFIIVFVVIGFMIMFRAQINPQTIVTIQSALPKMVVTLILITFSYAIAGFVVDLLYLLIFMFTGVLEAFGLIADATLAQNTLFGFSIFRIGISFLIAPLEAAGSAANAISAIAMGLFGVPNLWLTDWFTDVVAYLIVITAIVIALARTLFALLMAYIGIVVKTIFAPLQLLFNAFPGSNTFSGWLKSLVADAAVFPAVAVMVLVGASLVGGSGGEGVTKMGIYPSGETNAYGFAEGSGFVPPMITSRGIISSRGTEEFGVEHIRVIIGLGIIMLLPEVAKVVREALGVKDTVGELAAEGFARGWRPWWGGAKKVGTGAGDYVFQNLSQTSNAGEVAYYIWRAVTGFGRT